MFYGCVEMPFKLIIFLTLLFQISLKGNILLVSLYGLYLEASPMMLGVIIGTGSILPMLLASIVGRLSDKMSISLLLTIGMFGSGFSLGLIYLFDNSISVLLIVQLLFGLFQIITVVSSQNLVGTISNEADRSKNYASYTLSVSIANFIGPFIVGITIDILSYSWTYVILALFAIVPGIIFLFIPVKSSKLELKEDVAEKSFKDLLFDPNLRTVFLTSGVILTGVGLFEFYFPIYTNSLGFSATLIGILVSLNAGAFIISRLIMRPLQNKYKPEQIIGGCLLLAGFTFFILPIIKVAPLLAIVSFMMGLGLGCCQPLSIAMAYEYSPKGHSGEVLGIRLTVNKAVQLSVPLIFGSLNFLGFFIIFWFNTALLMGSGSSLLRKFKGL